MMPQIRIFLIITPELSRELSGSGFLRPVLVWNQAAFQNRVHQRPAKMKGCDLSNLAETLYKAPSVKGPNTLDF